MANVTGSVRVLKRKRGDQWYMFYRRRDGVQVKRKIGPAWAKKGKPAAGCFTEKMAEVELRKRLVEVEAEAPSRQDVGVTFEQATTEYLRFVREERQIDEKTARDYEGVVTGKGYLLDEFGRETPITDITADDVDDYKRRLMTEGKLSNRTIVRHLTVLHGIFKRAKRAYGLTENPASADMVERPKVVYTGEFDTFSRDEIELLASHADSPQDAAIFRVAAYTGLRQGELLALRWGAVDFMDGLLHVRRNFTGGEDKIPKGKRVRSVPMMSDVIDVLGKLKDRGDFTADDDLVFCSETGGYLDHFELRKRYYAALEAASLRRIRFHDLRHAFGTAAITKLDPHRVQGYMGHKHFSTTQRYLHHKPRREDAAALAEAFGGNGVTNGVTKRDDSTGTERNSAKQSVPGEPQRQAA